MKMKLRYWILVPALAFPFLAPTPSRALCQRGTPTTPTVTPTHTAEPETKPGKEEKDAALIDADKMFQNLAKIRGLALKGPVNKEFKDKAFFRDYFGKSFDKSLPPEKLKTLIKVDIALGILDKPVDLRKESVEESVEGILGLYDPDTKTLYIAEWTDPAKWREILAHELVHALQDQYFDLNGYLDKMRTMPRDQSLALSCLVEGEAVALSRELLLKEEDPAKSITNTEDIRKLNRIDFLLQAGKNWFRNDRGPIRSMGFQYAYGATLYQKYVQKNGWTGLDKLYADPPKSSTQVLYPEKYLGQREKPLKIRITGLEKGPLAGYKKIWEDSFGEYGLMGLLYWNLRKAGVWGGVRGWRGDIFQVYEDARGRTALLGYAVFESEHFAANFFNNYRRVLEEKYCMENQVYWNEDISYRVKDPKTGTENHVELRGSRVAFMERMSPEQIERVLADIWPK